MQMAEFCELLYADFSKCLMFCILEYMCSNICSNGVYAYAIRIVRIIVMCIQHYTTLYI